MAEESRTTPVSVELARHLGLFSATMIGVGAMIGAGIFVLTGMATGLAGPAAILAFGLNGIVTLFTALSYAELASAFPISGGGYAFIKKVMPNFVAFMAGWMLWCAYIIACSLYAKGFGSYTFELIEAWHPDWAHQLVNALEIFGGQAGAVALLTVLAGIFFIGLNILGTAASGQAENLFTLIKMVILAVFIYFGFARVVEAPEVARANFEPFLPLGTTGILAAMGLTFIAFEGYDLIATMNEEIQEPRKNVPKAILLSLIITVAIYLLVVFVCLAAVAPQGGVPTWQFLGEAKETGIIEAARSFMPNFGVGLIIFGGLFSTMSALNATVMASSRVAFSMGRDKMLSDSLGRLHATRRTPTLAIILSGFIFLGVAVFFPLETVGVATSLLFLLSFGLTNVALMIYRNRREGEPPPFQVPLYPLTPILGILTCVALAGYQLATQPVASALALVWILVGLGIYAAFFRRRVDIADVVETIEQPELLRLKDAKTYKILVPLANPERVKPMIWLASQVARSSQGEVIALAVVKLPGVTPYSEAGDFMEQAQSVLRDAQEAAVALDMPLTLLTTVARDVSEEIVRVAKDQKCSLILMGDRKESDPLENSIIHDVIVDQPCDVAILNTDGDWEPEVNRLLVPIAGREEVHGRLKVRLAHSLCREQECDLSLLNVVPPEAGEGGKEQANDLLVRVAKDYPEGGRPLVDVNEEPIDAIAARSRENDLMILGMREEPWFRTFLFGTISQQLSARVGCPTIMVKTRAEGRSLMKRLLGIGSTA